MAALGWLLNLDFAATGATDVTVSGALGQIEATGYAATVTANIDTDVSGALGQIVIEGYSASIDDGIVTSTATGGWEQRKQRDILRTETTEERRRRIRAAREALGIIEPVREIAAEQLPDEDIDAPPGESVEALQARLEIVLEALDRQQAINVRKRKAAAVLLLAV